MIREPEHQPASRSLHDLKTSSRTILDSLALSEWDISYLNLQYNYGVIENKFNIWNSKVIPYSYN